MITFPYISTWHTETIVSVDKAKGWLRLPLDYLDEDHQIEELIDAAVRHVEEKCNLSLGISTYTWNTSGLPCNFRDAKYVKEIVSITIDGVELEANTHYKLVRTGQVYSRIDWMGVSPGRETTIVFKAGFGADQVPPNLIKAIRALVVDAYDHRGDGVSEKKSFSDKIMDLYIHEYVG